MASLRWTTSTTAFTPVLRARHRSFPALVTWCGWKTRRKRAESTWASSEKKPVVAPHSATNTFLADIVFIKRIDSQYPQEACGGPGEPQEGFGLHEQTQRRCEAQGTRCSEGQAKGQGEPQTCCCQAAVVYVAANDRLSSTWERCLHSNVAVSSSNSNEQWM